MFLDHKKETCLIDIPFDKKSNINVIQVVEKADTLNVCRLAATAVPDCKFFFWSENPNPLGSPKTSNCYVFKSCAEKDYTALKFPGNTYQRQQGEWYTKTVLLFAYASTIISYF